ncbi:MAG TPA: PQQ-binding-like beta-propeller repeat protein [Nitrososphaerales archaeon]|nr:PQQ-binding-like beta-propeller repeat protein [Nitrososphaerales archaeon]
MHKIYSTLLIFLMLTPSIIVLVPHLATGQLPPVGNWFATGYDYDHTGFNPQTVINRDNVDDLEFRWVYQLPLNPYRNILQPSLGLETNPLLVNGILYFSASYNKLFAVNTLRGNLVWSHEVNVTEALKNPNIGNFGLQHAIVYHDGLIYQFTIDCTLFGFDASSGKVMLEIPGICDDIPGNKGQYFGEEAPSIYEKDGKKIGIVSIAAGLFYARGFVAAYDLDSGELLWRWFSVPPQVAGGDPNWDAEANKGNIDAYPGDWGTTGEHWGGSIWVSSAIDEETGTVFLATGYPGVGLTLAGHMDANLTPGPNLYTNSVIALDVETGDLKWYYQTTPHDVLQHGFGWSVVLAKATIDGEEKKVVVAGSKSGYVYELDAETGELVIPPVEVGVHLKNHNSNLGNNADMTLNQIEELACPGGNGGIEAPLAFSQNTIFVASQNRCFHWRPIEDAYKGERVWVAGPAVERPQNATLYAVDASTGGIKWRFDMPNPYQGAGIIVSGGVVYAQDRIGTLYMLDEETGEELRTIFFGGLGAAGVTIGTNPLGEMMLFVPSGGGEIIVPTPGTITAFGLREQIDTGEENIFSDEVTYIAITVAIVMVGIVAVNYRKKIASR